MNRKIFVSLLTFLAQFSMPIWAMDSSSSTDKVETIVVFFHGMKQTASMWEEMFNMGVKPEYKEKIKQSKYEPIEKGTLKVYFPEGKVDSLFGKMPVKMWFDLKDSFKKDIEELKEKLQRPLTKEELIAYLRPEESGLTAAVRENLEYVKGLMRKHELSAENVILVGYSQGGIIASLISQYLGSSCLNLFLINSLFMPAEKPLSRPNQIILTYGGLDNVISEHVYIVSIESMAKLIHENDVIVKRFEKIKHDFGPGVQLAWVFDMFNEILESRNAIF